MPRQPVAAQRGGIAMRWRIIHQDDGKGDMMFISGAMVRQKIASFAPEMSFVSPLSPESTGTRCSSSASAAVVPQALAARRR